MKKLKKNKKIKNLRLEVWPPRIKKIKKIKALIFLIILINRDPAVRLGSFGFKKVKKNLKAVRVVSVPLRFGSSRFKKRFGSMSAIRVLPESNSNLAISFQSILCWNYF